MLRQKTTMTVLPEMIDKDEDSMAIYIGYLYGGVAGIYVLIMYRI